MSKEKTIFHELNMDDLKRFEEIISKDNVNCRMITRGIYPTSDKCVETKVCVYLNGTDIDTKFETKHETYTGSYQEAMKLFLDWWDKEIVRFNSFSQLTKSNKKKL